MLGAKLSREQERAFGLYRLGQNLFISGPGGSGKSHLIRAVYRDAVDGGKQVTVCALTGCASVLLDCRATTVHSWSGIGLGTSPKEQLLSKIRSSPEKLKRWTSIDLLIVDEVSMMSSELFETLLWLGKNLRGSEDPFGGIQVIFSGDFYQLPPISGQFCFQSPLWKQSLDSVVVFEAIHRQDEPEFVKVLNQIRRGRISRRSNRFLEAVVQKPPPTDASSILPTRILPTRAMVNQINTREQERLSGDQFDFYAREGRASISDLLQRRPTDANQTSIRKQHPWPGVTPKISLSVSTQVMCCVNIDVVGNGVCNGSRGIVVGFLRGAPVVKFLNGVEMVIEPHVWDVGKRLYVTQIPLILAWAITIHKSQGASLDCASVDIGSNVFECGQIYVALSRLRSAKHLWIENLDIHKIKAHPAVIAYYDEVTRDETTPFPTV